MTLVTYTAGIVNNLYWASMTHRSSPTRPRYLDLAHVVNSKDIKYGAVVNSQTYWFATHRKLLLVLLLGGIPDSIAESIKGGGSVSCA